jgi:ParB-like chromosome segregation protein Spo0J
MTDRTMRVGFGRYVVALPMSSITAQRRPTASTQKRDYYRKIAASLEHIGLIEPLVVFKQPDGTFLLLDGNVRFEVLRDRGEVEVPCIIADDDEGYTYNRRVNHVPPIVQHLMLCRALEGGVSAERVATALNVDVRSIREKRDMLKGICPEVVRLLEGRRLSVRAFAVLRKMKPVRQIEAAEHMIASNNFTLPLIKAILLITKAEMLTDSQPNKATARTDGEARALVREHQGLVRDLKTVEASFGSDMLMLAVSLKYLEKLMKNARIKQYLERTLPETLLVAQELLRDAGSASETEAA